MRIVFISALILLLNYGCTDEKLKPQIESSISSDEIPTHEIWNAEVKFTDEGKLNAILFADHLQKYENTKTTFLDGVRIFFYDENQIHTSTLTSKKGRVDNITQDMFAIDSVVAVSDSGVVLRTEELMWRNKDKKIISDKFVRIISESESIEGYGLESDQHFNVYTVLNPTIVTTLKEDSTK